MTDPAPSVPFRLPKLLPWFVALAGAAVYLNTLPNEFVFDDTAYLRGQTQVGSLHEAWSMLLSSRGLPNLTFALNRLVDGEEPRGYHLVNLVIHVLAGLTLFGLVRAAATAVRPANLDPSWFAFAVALLWVVHPLNTQAVTYVIQRHESMMGLFYLLTLYGVARVAMTQEARCSPMRVALWATAAVLACAAGMASKQVMVTAPIVVFLFDRAFFAREAALADDGMSNASLARKVLATSVARTLRRRWWLYVALAATWPIALRDVGHAVVGGEGASAGFSIEIFTWRQYLLSQGEVILWYLRLSFVPWPLVLDYGWLPSAVVAERVPGRLVPDVIAPVAAVLALLGVSLVGLWLNRAWGFLGFTFFAVLSVSSSVIPIADLAMEHRMYLSLACVITLAVLAAHRLLGKLSLDSSVRPAVAAVALAAVVSTFGVLAVLRNAEYRTAISLWTTVVERAPQNPRGWHNLGEAYGKAGEPDVAVRHYERAIDLVPTFADARHNLGKAWLDLGRPADAETQFRAAIVQRPDDAESLVGLAGSLIAQRRGAEAEPVARRAIELSPQHARAHNNLGVALGQQGRGEEAIALFREAIALDAELLDAYRNLAGELVRAGRMAEAADIAEAAVAAAERAGADARVVEQMRRGAAQLRAAAER